MGVFLFCCTDSCPSQPISHPGGGRHNTITATLGLSITGLVLHLRELPSNPPPPQCPSYVLMVSSIIEPIYSVPFDIQTYGEGSPLQRASFFPHLHPHLTVWLSPPLSLSLLIVRALSAWVNHPLPRLLPSPPSGDYSLDRPSWLALTRSSLRSLARATYRGRQTERFERWETVTGWQRCTHNWQQWQRKTGTFLHVLPCQR